MSAGAGLPTCIARKEQSLLGGIFGLGLLASVWDNDGERAREMAVSDVATLQISAILGR